LQKKKSTFTDTFVERNTLIEKVYPKIKQYCRSKYGFEFQVVDMRWGVHEEALDDHATTKICLNEIKVCQRLSAGPDFVTFLGQKYGYRPIPASILQVELDLLKQMLNQAARSDDVALIEEWFRLDENSVPLQYVLQPISSKLAYFNDPSNPEMNNQHRSE